MGGSRWVVAVGEILPPPPPPPRPPACRQDQGRLGAQPWSRRLSQTARIWPWSPGASPSQLRSRLWDKGQCRSAWLRSLGQASVPPGARSCTCCAGGGTLVTLPSLGMWQLLAPCAPLWPAPSHEPANPFSRLLSLGAGPLGLFLFGPDFRSFSRSPLDPRPSFLTPWCLAWRPDLKSYWLKQKGWGVCCFLNHLLPFTLALPPSVLRGRLSRVTLLNIGCIMSLLNSELSNGCHSF